MSEIIEEIYQGYCRTLDQARTVTCEYHMDDNKKVIEYVDCSYGKCVHSKTCKLIEPIRENDIENGSM